MSLKAALACNVLAEREREGIQNGDFQLVRYKEQAEKAY